MITPQAGPHAAKCRLRLLIFVLLADAEQKEAPPPPAMAQSPRRRLGVQTKTVRQEVRKRPPHERLTPSSSARHGGPLGSPVTDRQTGRGGWARSPETGPKVNLQPDRVDSQVLRYYRILNSKQGRTNNRNNQRVERPTRPLHLFPCF